MDRLGAGLPRGVDDLVDAQVALDAGAGPMRTASSAMLDMERRAIGVAIDRDGGDAHLAARCG